MHGSVSRVKEEEEDKEIFCARLCRLTKAQNATQGRSWASITFRNDIGGTKGVAMRRAGRQTRSASLQRSTRTCNDPEGSKREDGATGVSAEEP